MRPLCLFPVRLRQSFGATRGGGRFANAGRVVRIRALTKRPPRRFWASRHPRSRRQADGSRYRAVHPSPVPTAPGSLRKPSEPRLGLSPSARPAALRASSWQPVVVPAGGSAGTSRRPGCETGPAGRRSPLHLQNASGRRPSRAGMGGIMRPLRRAVISFSDFGGIARFRRKSIPARKRGAARPRASGEPAQWG